MNVAPKISHNPSCPWNFVQIPKTANIEAKPCIYWCTDFFKFLKLDNHKIVVKHKKPNLACIDALISSNFLN